MAYATPADLASYMSVPSVDTATATLLLQIVSSQMDDYAGQSLAHQDVVDLLVDGSGANQLILPGFPVTAVASVEVLAGGAWTTLTEGSDYVWSASAVLTRVFSSFDRGGPIGPAWPSRPRSVRVSYSRGEGAVSESIKGVCLAATARIMPNPTGLTSEQIGAMQIRYSKSGGVEFSILDKRTLDRASETVIA